MHSVEPVGLDGLPPNLTEKSSPPNLRHDCARVIDAFAEASLMETFVCRATRSSGSPRNSRATIAILR